MLLRRTRKNEGLTDLVDQLTTGYGPYNSQTIAQPYTLAESNAYVPLTLNRILLSYSYMTQGLIQTVIRQPVDDAFRGGFVIKTPELDEDDLALLTRTLKRSRKRAKRSKEAMRNINPNAGVNYGNSDIETVMATLNWARLYGGAGMIVNTAQLPSTPLDVEMIDQETPLEFIAADRWELILSQTNIWNEQHPCPYNYYGIPLHFTRVVKVLGVEAPSYIRLRLQGWGMSEIERCIRAINSFLKFETLVFELLDEAKLDVYKIQGFNENLVTEEGTENVQRRILLANRLKSYQNALTMDAEDDFAQKQITWSGLAEIWNEIRMNLSSALKIPMNKLFGQSATGFGGGQDAIENYNSIVEQVRLTAEPLVNEVIDLRCQQLFGFIPDYTVEWPQLKVLDGVQEEEVRTSKQKRALELFQQRLMTGIETSRVLRADGLLHQDTEVLQGLRDVEPVTADSQPGGPTNQKPKAPAKKDK